MRDMSYDGMCHAVQRDSFKPASSVGQYSLSFLDGQVPMTSL